LPDDERADNVYCEGSEIIVLSNSANLYRMQIDQKEFQKIIVNIGNAAMKIRDASLASDKTLALLQLS
jgi:hypothetical protein